MYDYLELINKIKFETLYLQKLQQIIENNNIKF